jgi:hypothetical protein
MDPESRSSSAPVLRPPWLLPARAGWLVYAAVCFVLFVMGTVNAARQPLERCNAPEGNCSAATLISLEDLETATNMGLPAEILFPASLVFSLFARLSLAAVGLLIFSRRSDDWVALVISGGLMSVLLEGNQGSDPTFVAVQGVLLGIGTALFLPIPFIFPTGRYEPRWVRRPAIVITAGYVLTVVFLLNTVMYPALSAGLTLAWAILALISMAYRFFRVSGPAERQQIKWVLLGISTTFVSGLYYSSMSTLFPITQPSEARMVALLINLPIYAGCYGFFAFSILVSVLRYRLWDIDVLIRRTLQYTILTGLLALIYFGGVVLLQGILGPLTADENSPLVTVITTLGIAALFTPLRKRIQQVIDRRFFRKKYDAERSLAGFAAAARDEVDMDRLAEALLGMVDETMQPIRSSLWLGGGKKAK